MTSTLFIVAVVIVTALFFDFTNGFHDSANAMATSVATAAFKPRTAVLIAAVLNVVGAFLSTEVAKQPTRPRRSAPRRHVGDAGSPHY